MFSGNVCRVFGDLWSFISRMRFRSLSFLNVTHIIIASWRCVAHAKCLRKCKTRRRCRLDVGWMHTSWEQCWLQGHYICITVFDLKPSECDGRPSSGLNARILTRILQLIYYERCFRCRIVFSWERERDREKMICLMEVPWMCFAMDSCALQNQWRVLPLLRLRSRKRFVCSVSSRKRFFPSTRQA